MPEKLPPIREVRKAIPLHVKVKAALLAAGFTWEDICTPGAIHWDHDPALGLRERKGRTKFVPDQLDPRHIVPMLRAPHREKTVGGPATVADGDIHKIHKAGRLAAEQAAFRKRLTAGTPGKRRAKAAQKRKRKWASRPMRSKP